MKSAVSPYYSRCVGAGEYPAPAIWQRVLLLCAAFLLLQLAVAPWLGVLLPSGRLLLAVPFLWLLDLLYTRRYRAWRAWDVARRIYNFGALIVAVALLLLTFWSLLVWQARELGGRVAPLEPFARLYVTASLWLVFVGLCHLWNAVINGMARRKRRENPARRWNVPAVALAVLLFLPYLFLALQIHRGKIANATDPRRELGLPYEDVTLRTEDGVRLSGWFIPHRQSDAAIVLCHGVSANKGAFLKFASFLHDEGFNVLLFDFRGHGDSAGYATSLGYYEARDVRAAVRYLQRRPEIRRIAGYGFSMGGAALIRAAADTPAIRCVVVDSAYSDMETLARREFSALPWGLDAAALRVLDVYTRLGLGAPLAAIAPRDSIGAISPRPLLLVHGMADARVPVEQARRNFAAAREPKTLWLVPGAAHVEAYRSQGATYERRVIAFLRRSL